MYKYIVNNYTRFLIMLKNTFQVRTESQILGRWCHVSLPKCCNNVIEKKNRFCK